MQTEKTATYAYTPDKKCECYSCTLNIYVAKMPASEKLIKPTEDVLVFCAHEQQQNTRLAVRNTKRTDLCFVSCYQVEILLLHHLNCARPCMLKKSQGPT